MAIRRSYLPLLELETKAALEQMGTNLLRQAVHHIQDGSGTLMQPSFQASQLPCQPVGICLRQLADGPDAKIMQYLLGPRSRNGNLPDLKRREGLTSILFDDNGQSIEPHCPEPPA